MTDVEKLEQDRIVRDLTRGASESRKTALAAEAVKLLSSPGASQPTTATASDAISKSEAHRAIVELEKMSSRRDLSDGQRAELAALVVKMQMASGLAELPIASHFNARR